jgi:hypothetical protein
MSGLERGRGKRRERDLDRSSHYVSSPFFCLSPLRVFPFLLFFMSGWDEKHNHQHFRSCDRAVLLWPRALDLPHFYRCGGVLSDRIGIRSIIWAFWVLVLFVSSRAKAEPLVRFRSRSSSWYYCILAHPPRLLDISHL